MIKQVFSKELCKQIEDGDTIGAKYEYSYRNDAKKKGDDSLLTRSRFMHTNAHDQQENGTEDNSKRTIDHTEELETLKGSISENEELIRQLEAQLQKLEGSIKKVSEHRIEKSVYTKYILVREVL